MLSAQNIKELAASEIMRREAGWGEEEEEEGGERERETTGVCARGVVFFPPPNCPQGVGARGAVDPVYLLLPGD